MGLIRAAKQSLNSVLADQWLEYYSCNSLASNVAIKRCRANTRGNNRGGRDIISKGSGFIVSAGQAVIIVDNGQITEFCAEPGIYTYDRGTEPSIFYAGNGLSLAESFDKIIERFKFGGNQTSVQRVYYVNTKELTGLKFGTSEPIVYDDAKYQSIGIRCHGTVSLKLINPIMFYENLAGNIEEEFYVDELWEYHLRNEFLAFLGQGLSQLSAQGIKFSQIPRHQGPLTASLNQILDSDWVQSRGIQISSIAIPSVSLDPKFQDKVNKYDDMQTMSNPINAAANLAAAQADALRLAAGNTSGALTGFMGMNMVPTRMPGLINNPNILSLGESGEGSGFNANQPYTGMVAGQGKTQHLTGVWVCACGQENAMRFCGNCARPKPQYQ